MANYSKDRVQLDIWIDRSKSGLIHDGVFKIASNFPWKFGYKSVHNHSQHVGIYGQWLDTWHPERTGSSEVPLFLEDDMIVSPYFYEWLKSMHKAYSSRKDVSGFSLQSKIIIMGGPKAQQMLSIPKKHLIYMYKVFGSWGFSPLPHVWRQFHTWYHTVKTDSTFKPYVPGILPTYWYKSFEKKNRQDTMWSMWFLYYTHSKNLFCIFPNFKDHLSINREVAGLHYGNDRHVRETGLITFPKKPFEFPTEPIKINYDGVKLMKKDKYT